MADKQAQAMERLLTKLSAVRKTLRGEERNLLDAMVLASQSEVTAHAKSLQPIGNKASRPLARGASDVELHSLNIRRADAGQKSSAAASRQVSSATSSKVNGPEGRQVLRVVLDDGNYRVTIL